MKYHTWKPLSKNLESFLTRLSLSLTTKEYDLCSLPYYKQINQKQEDPINQVKHEQVNTLNQLNSEQVNEDERIALSYLFKTFSNLGFPIETYWNELVLNGIATETGVGKTENELEEIFVWNVDLIKFFSFLKDKE